MSKDEQFDSDKLRDDETFVRALFPIRIPNTRKKKPTAR